MRTAAMSIADLLSFRHRFVVPEFQRVYGWGETELNRLFADVEAALLGGHGRFFLGTIYLATTEDGTEAQIADGQQRLLTATMVYAAARDLAEDPAIADKLHEILSDPGSERFRFVPRDRDAEFFRTWVLERGATLRPLKGEEASTDGEEAPELSGSQLNMIRNRDAIVERLRALGADGRRMLIDFHTVIKVIVIMADTLEEARNAYATTQTRGLRQSETDKLKAELIGDCPQALRARLAGHWEECEAKLGRDDFADLFHHLIVIESERRPQVASEADLFGVFDLPGKVAHFIENVLVPSAEAYRRICNAGGLPDRAYRRANDALVPLLRCTHAGWKAPAILAMRQFGAGRQLDVFLANLERLASVLMIAGADPYRIQESYIAVIRDIKRGNPTGGTSLHADAKDLALVREYLLSPRFAHRERFRMPVLLKLNDILAGKVIHIDPRKVSCEHILPVNPPRRGPWRNTFRGVDGRYNGGTFAHMLGNITILTHLQNREADNSPYSIKRRILKGSGFALSKHAAKRRDWTAQVIAARTDYLFAELVRAWRLNDPV